MQNSHSLNTHTFTDIDIDMPVDVNEDLDTHTHTDSKVFCPLCPIPSREPWAASKPVDRLLWVESSRGRAGLLSYRSRATEAASAKGTLGEQFPL